MALEVDPKHVMSFHEWQQERRSLQEVEIKERQGSIESARAHLQVAVTEQAIRKLYAAVLALNDRVSLLEKAKVK